MEHHKAAAVLDSWKDRLFLPLFSSSGLLSEIRAFLASIALSLISENSATVKPYTSSAAASKQIFDLRSSRRTKQHQHVRWQRAATSFLHSRDLAARCPRRWHQTTETGGSILGLETLLTSIQSFLHPFCCCAGHRTHEYT